MLYLANFNQGWFSWRQKLIKNNNTITKSSMSITFLCFFVHFAVLYKSHQLSYASSDPEISTSTNQQLPSQMQPSEYAQSSPKDINTFNIWNHTLYHEKNQQGILPGEIKFCYWPWKPFKIEKNHPIVLMCRGHDLLYLSYQINVQKVETDSSFQSLNDHFAVVVTYGDECLNPKQSITDASQADCHNYEEYNVVKGEKCLRRQIVVNTYKSDVACFIVYCTNHRSHCDVWVTSHWNKYVYINPSWQTLKPPVSEMMISGRNFASNVSNIKIRCIDEEERILNCSVTWVNNATGKEAIVTFTPQIGREHTGKVSVRMDSDDTGWTQEVVIGVIIDEIYPWISMTIAFSTFLIGIVPIIVFLIYWQIKTWNKKFNIKHKVKKRKILKDTKRSAIDVIKYELPGWD